LFIEGFYCVVTIKKTVLLKVSVPQGFAYSEGSCAFAAAAAWLAGFGLAAPL
jgi:hypothetical protein